MYGKSVISALVAGISAGFGNVLDASRRIRLALTPVRSLPKRGKVKARPAGSKIARKCGQLTCRHPVGTHHKQY